MRSILGHIAIAPLLRRLSCGSPARMLRSYSPTLPKRLALPSRSWLTESVAWGDYDNDGDEDLYLTVDGPNHLFRNDGGGHFTDVTDVAGVGNQGFSVGTAFGDLDNDGDLDLYVVNFSGGLDVLYRNDGPVGPGGAYRFTDITRVGMVRTSSGRAAAWPLSISTGTVCSTSSSWRSAATSSIETSVIFRFGNVAGPLGVDQDDQGVGVVAADINDDGWPDLFTGNRSSESLEPLPEPGWNLR